MIVTFTRWDLKIISYDKDINDITLDDILPMRTSALTELAIGAGEIVTVIYYDQSDIHKFKILMSPTPGWKQEESIAIVLNKYNKGELLDLIMSTVMDYRLGRDSPY